MAGGRVRLNAGSSKAILGKRAEPLTVFLACCSVSTRTAYGVTSLPVPAVVGDRDNREWGSGVGGGAEILCAGQRVGRKYGDGLGGVHRAAAAEGDNPVRAGLPAEAPACFAAFGRRVFLHLVKDGRRRKLRAPPCRAGRSCARRVFPVTISGRSKRPWQCSWRRAIPPAS